MQIDVITLFPDMLQAVTGYGVTGRAVKNGALQVAGCNPRDYTTDNYRTVDDRPYGGGPGMVMMVEPLQKAVQDLKQQAGGKAKTIYLSPQGRPLTQQVVEELATESNLILIAGRYEGIDERFIELEVDEELSLGDYVLSGGELGAMVVIDAVARLLPGVLGHVLSAEQDSFVAGLLDCPHYTRPEIYQQREVPPVLLSGDHKKIAQWRLKQALGRTWLRRPDLLAKRELNKQERALLAEFQQEHDETNFD